MNSQNNKYWYAKNPTIIHDMPLCDINVGVSCALEDYFHPLPLFFPPETVHSCWCVVERGVTRYLLHDKNKQLHRGNIVFLSDSIVSWSNTLCHICNIVEYIQTHLFFR